MEKKTKKAKMPWTVRQKCLGIVRDYERQRRTYRQLRRDIIDAGGARYSTYTVNGEERRAFIGGSHEARRTTEDRQMQLDALEQTALAREVHAVEGALACVGQDMPVMLRDMLTEALVMNCQNGRKWPYERLFVAGISRSDFYRIRNAFFDDIAERLGQIW